MLRLYASANSKRQITWELSLEVELRSPKPTAGVRFPQLLHRRIDNVFGRCFSLSIGNFEGFEHPIQASKKIHLNFDYFDVSFL